MSIRLLPGDCRAVLATLEAESVQCVVTSPPYYGLRDYGVDGQIGLEQSPAEYVAQLVEVFREVRRVLRADGTVWLNLGDSYASDTKGTGGKNPQVGGGKAHILQGQNYGARRFNHGLKPKDLMLIPARVAIALQEDGWWIRSEIIWSKSAPMPESVRDRPTCAHEKVWLLTKASTYFYDADAVREPFADDRQGSSGTKSWAYTDGSGRNGDQGLGKPLPYEGRNLRNVIRSPSDKVRLRRDMTIEQKSRIMGQLIQRGII